MSDIEYILPKTYNGKTVTELFPEFKHNSTLRFSKIFGSGRLTSLPKLWKGAKKRKKLNDPQNIDILENQENYQKSNHQQESLTSNKFNINNVSIDETSDHETEDKEIQINYGRVAQSDELAVDDDQLIVQKYRIEEENQTKTALNQQQSQQMNNSKRNWRYGPASFWYSQKIGDDFDYGFKKSKSTLETSILNSKPNEDSMIVDSDIQDTFSLTFGHELNIPSESFLLVNTLNWDEKVILDNSQIRDKIDLSNERIKFAGWIPSAEHRSLSSFQSKVFGRNIEYLNKKDEETSLLATVKTNLKWNSIFPNENYDLVYGDWEKNIIYDPQNMDTALSPPEFVLDANDDNLLFSIPDEPVEIEENKTKETPTDTTAKKKKNELYEYRAKISKSLLGRTGILKEDGGGGGGGPNEEKEDQNRGDSKDFWNLSNDDYYSPKINPESSTTKNTSTLIIQHTSAAIELRPPFFPTHISIMKLRSFHRLVLKKYQNGLLSELKLHCVSSVYKDSIMMSKKQSNAVTTSSGESCFIKNISELTAMDGTIILAEYSEQYPPLMMQTGMATKIKSYYKRKIGKDDGPPQLEYGETVLAHNSSQFLGSLKPGDYLQSFENYLFRSPIFLHETPITDFLIIRTRQVYFIRCIKDIFVVGQECPLIEVPGPNSKRANLFIKDFLQAYIFRLFHRSRDKPKRIKMEDIRKAFPLLAESSIRKRLKICADFKRAGLTKISGSDANWWVLKDNVRLPTEDEIRSSVTPEQCCAYYSMLAAEQRLKDAGYGEKNLFAADDEDVDNIKIDDEVKNAPWHTTRAYLDAIKGKCFLQVNGVADPTGRGEGFSYVRQPFKPTNTKQEEEQEKQQQKEQAAQNKRMVTGTDADLRRLNLKDAKKLLLKYGLPQEEIDKLKRWEIIDVVRTMSTQKAKEGSETAFSKFARGNRQTQSDAHQKFREECQRIFELQNRSLASREVLSTDDDEDSNEDSDVDEMGKNLESMLQSKRSNETSTAETSNEKELKQLIMPNRLLSANNDSNSFDRTENSQEESRMDGLKSKLFSNQDKQQNRILKITRTYKNEDTGEDYTVVETVKKPLIIDAYIRIRTTKDDDYIRQAFALDEEEREQLRKERRRLQEQLRRVKRNEAARRVNESKDDGDSEPLNEGGGEISIKKPPKKKYKKHEQTSLDESGLNVSISSANKDSQPIKTVKCGACGTIGHSKSNRECPLFTPKELNVSHGETNTNDNDNSQTSGFTKVQGTKLIIDKRVMATQKPPKKYKKKQQVDQDQSKSADQSMNVSQKGEEECPSSPSSTPLKKKLILTIPKEKLNNKNKTVKPLKLNKLKQQLEKQSLKLQQKLNSPNPMQIPKKTIHLKQQQVTDSPIIINPLPSANQNPVLDFQNLFFPQQSIFQQQQQQQQLQQQQLQPQILFQSQMSSSFKDKQRRKNVSQTHCDYLDKPQKKVDRRHIDPLVSFGSILENILNELRDLPDSQPFLLPVNAKKVTDYYTVIKNPIDLQTIRKKIQDKLYMNQQAFLDDMKLLVSNSELYNGSNHFIANQARNLYDNCLKRVVENRERLIRLEKAINPLLDDNNLIKFNYLLEKMFNEQIMNIENSYAFHKPVNKAKYKDYYDLIKNPIDLETIKNKIITKKYKTREQFISDFNLLYSNCETYNGPNHSYTKTAEKILNTCKSAINSNEQLAGLEVAIESSFLIGDAMRHSIDMTDSESNLAPYSSLLHETESNDNNVFSASLLATLSKTSLNAAMSSQSMASSAINYHEEHVIQNISSKGSAKQAQMSSNTSRWFPKLQLNLSPQSISTSEQDIYVDVETFDDKHAAMDDLQISDDDDDDDQDDDGDDQD